MVTLEFKQTVMRGGALFDYKQQLVDVVRNVAPSDAQGVQKRGFQEGDLDTALALADKIEQANGRVELSAAEVMTIADKVANVQWPFADAAFKQFCTDIKALKDA